MPVRSTRFSDTRAIDRTVEVAVPARAQEGAKNLSALAFDGAVSRAPLVLCVMRASGTDGWLRLRGADAHT